MSHMRCTHELHSCWRAASCAQAYDKLCGKLKELSALQGISGLLGWDEMWVGWMWAAWPVTGAAHPPASDP